MIDPEPRRQPSPRQLLVDHLDLVERLIAHVCARFRLRGDEASEFAAQVMLELVDDDYAVLRDFAGRSKLSTYLTAVIVNLARDHRCRRVGRWRASAAAHRLGTAAVQLETLLERDRFSLRESVEMLQRHHGVGLSALEIADLAARLPPRTRRRFASPSRLDRLPSREKATARVEASEAGRTLRAASSALASALRALSPEDRLILRMRFESGLQVAAIARTLGLPQKPLYTRIGRCLEALRRDLESRGLAAQEVLAALETAGLAGALD